MKFKYVLPFFLLFTVFMFGQSDGNEQIMAVKSSRIAAALNLTSTEAPKFWQLYLACEEKTYDIKHNKIRPITMKLEAKGGIDALSPKEAGLYIMQLDAADEEIYNLKKKLMNDLKPVIGPKKILKLKIAEDKFNKMLLNKVKNKKD